MKEVKIDKEALEEFQSGLLKIVKALDRVIDAPAPADTESLTSQTPIKVEGHTAPWVAEGLRWEGKAEAADEKELTEFLGFNPNEATGGKSWCAGFWISIFSQLGCDTSGLNLMATSFKTFGYAIDTICDGAILVFEPKPDAPYPIRHVGVAVDGCQKLFGGNQGDQAKKSNLQWYLDNAELTAIRCPAGYELV